MKISQVVLIKGNTYCNDGLAYLPDAPVGVVAMDPGLRPSKFAR